MTLYQTLSLVADDLCLYHQLPTNNISDAYYNVYNSPIAAAWAKGSHPATALAIIDEKLFQNGIGLPYASCQLHTVVILRYSVSHS